ncbi:hypothetical protein E1956_23855 [Paraburkholderia pallida]|uniref:Uncharacterized protein n=1 Tax=Paraburkholderia pallida TaxID=2547399 RepID=A0A4P7D0W6_9BURK|nr:hypothetical protein E1956_23855 [Paraburkholderia pallida]
MAAQGCVARLSECSKSDAAAAWADGPCRRDQNCTLRLSNLKVKRWNAGFMARIACWRNAVAGLAPGRREAGVMDRIALSCAPDANASGAPVTRREK